MSFLGYRHLQLFLSRGIVIASVELMLACLLIFCSFIKEALYRIWCGANRLGDGGVHTLGDNSAFVNPAGQLLLPGGARPEYIPSA